LRPLPGMDHTGQEYKAELLVRPGIEAKISTRSVHASFRVLLGCGWYDLRNNRKAILTKLTVGAISIPPRPSLANWWRSALLPSRGQTCWGQRFNICCARIPPALAHLNTGEQDEKSPVERTCRSTITDFVDIRELVQ